MRQLILQDRHETYHEIETTLGVSGTSIHSFDSQKNLFTLVPTQFVNRSKKPCVDWLKETLQKYDRGASKHVYDIVTVDESRLDRK